MRSLEDLIAFTEALSPSFAPPTFPFTLYFPIGILILDRRVSPYTARPATKPPLHTHTHLHLPLTHTRHLTFYTHFHTPNAAKCRRFRSTGDSMIFSSPLSGRISLMMVFRPPLVLPAAMVYHHQQQQQLRVLLCSRRHVLPDSLH